MRSSNDIHLFSMEDGVFIESLTKQYIFISNHHLNHFYVMGNFGIKLKFIILLIQNNQFKPFYMRVLICVFRYYMFKYLSLTKI